MNKLIKTSYFIIIAISGLYSSLNRFNIEESDRDNIIEYQIKPGDNLWEIAVTHKSSIPHIKALNNIKSNIIHPGENIKIPIGAFIDKMDFVIKWREAVLHRKESKLMESITLFEYIIENSLQEDLSSQSQFQIADIYLNDINNYTFALNNFKKVIDEYPDSKERKKSIFMAGYIYSNYIESYSDAINYYNMFLDEYPDDELSHSVYYELDLLDSLGIPSPRKKKN